MYIWLVSRTTPVDWDQWIAVVVVAASEEEARLTFPWDAGAHGKIRWDGEEWKSERGTPMWGWAPPDTLVVNRVGTADEGLEPGVVLDSFKAG